MIPESRKDAVDTFGLGPADSAAPGRNCSAAVNDSTASSHVFRRSFRVISALYRTVAPYKGQLLAGPPRNSLPNAPARPCFRGKGRCEFPTFLQHCWPRSSCWT